MRSDARPDQTGSRRWSATAGCAADVGDQDRRADRSRRRPGLCECRRAIRLSSSVLFRCRFCRHSRSAGVGRRLATRQRSRRRRKSVVPSTTASGSCGDGRTAGGSNARLLDLLHAFGSDGCRRRVKQNRQLIDGEQRTTAVTCRRGTARKSAGTVERKRCKRGRELIKLTLRSVVAARGRSQMDAGRVERLVEFGVRGLTFDRRKRRAGRTRSLPGRGPARRCSRLRRRGRGQETVWPRR